jgi:hypothetical protein
VQHTYYDQQTTNSVPQKKIRLCNLEIFTFSISKSSTAFPPIDIFCTLNICSGVTNGYRGDGQALEMGRLLNQGYLLVKLKSSLRKLYGRHHDLVDLYGISMSPVTTDIFHLSQTPPGPFLIHDLLPCY